MMDEELIEDYIQRLQRTKIVAKPFPEPPPLPVLFNTSLSQPFRSLHQFPKFPPHSINSIHNLSAIFQLDQLVCPIPNGAQLLISEAWSAVNKFKNCDVLLSLDMQKGQAKYKVLHKYVLLHLLRGKKLNFNLQLYNYLRQLQKATVRGSYKEYGKRLKLQFRVNSYWNQTLLHFRVKRLTSLLKSSYQTSFGFQYFSHRLAFFVQKLQGLNILNPFLAKPATLLGLSHKLHVQGLRIQHDFSVDKTFSKFQLKQLFSTQFSVWENKWASHDLLCRTDLRIGNNSRRLHNLFFVNQPNDNSQFRYTLLNKITFRGRVKPYRPFMFVRNVIKDGQHQTTLGLGVIALNLECWLGWSSDKLLWRVKWI